MCASRNAIISSRHSPQSFHSSLRWFQTANKTRWVESGKTTIKLRNSVNNMLILTTLLCFVNVTLSDNSAHILWFTSDMRAAIGSAAWTYCKKYMWGSKKRFFLQSTKAFSSILHGTIDPSHKVTSPLNHYNLRTPTQSDKYIFIVQFLLHVSYNPETIWCFFSYFRDGKWFAILSWGTWPRNLTIQRMEPSLSTPTKKTRTRQQSRLKRVAWIRVNQTILLLVFKGLRLETEPKKDVHWG